VNPIDYARDEIDEIAAEVSGNYEVEPGKTLKQLLAEKISKLQSEFETLYGISGDKMWFGYAYSIIRCCRRRND
jgi:hypothetical protein